MPLQCSRCKTRHWNKSLDSDLGGWVYLAQAIEPRANSLTKIGWSTQPHVRMTALRDPDGQKVKMIVAMPCDTQLGESKMHQIFSQYRVCGEWFALTSELIEKAKKVNLFELLKPLTGPVFDNHGNIVGEYFKSKPVRDLTLDYSERQE